MRKQWFAGQGKTTVALCLLLVGMAAQAAPRWQAADTLPAGSWPDHSEDLCAVADDTATYLARGEDYDPAVNHGGTLPDIAQPVARLIETLHFLCDIQREDQAAERPSRLTDPAFIAEHFEMVRWHPDQQNAHALGEGRPLLAQLPDNRLLLTKYYVRLADGRAEQGADTPHALYGTPFDEAHLTLAEADSNAPELTRYRYGKQAVVAMETKAETAQDFTGLAPPLVWLSRADLEGALLQGTAVVQDEQGQRQYFNVHRNNGVAYDRTRRPEEQERYWYFKEVAGVLGYGKDADEKIPVRPKVTVAGDVFQLGLGRVILLRTTEHGEPVYRLTVLADTGGAFHDNLYQLDWLSGYYRDWDDYHAANRHRGDYAEAWLLLKRQ